VQCGRRIARSAIAIAVASAGISGCGSLPAIAAGGLLHPARRPVSTLPPPGCIDAAVVSDGLTLRGWRCVEADRRATIVYLHGIADNRASAAHLIDRFQRRGFNVMAFDSRAHGTSDGDTCTYGYFEKQDLRLIVETAPQGLVVLIGTSLGAAIALQEATDDPRVSAVVAAETFSDLRTVAMERAPWILSRSAIDRAFAIAERDGRFNVDDVSPVASARRIRVPVLLIHGAADNETPPAHSERVFAALQGPKRLILVPGAHHNESLSRPGVWLDVDGWIDEALRLRRD
jgi:alpha-beta hydrolase superfamily lysophospholipase